MPPSVSRDRERVLDVWEVPRRGPEEGPEVAVHVRLVGVAAGVRRVRERRPGAQEADGVLEAREPRERLRRQADLAAEALAEVAPAPARLARERLDADGAVRGGEPAVRVAHLPGHGARVLQP